MLSSRPLEDMGDLRGVILDFEYAGDVLPKHVHTPENIHITIVLKGRIRAYSHDWSVEAGPGEPNILKFRAGEPHEIAALADGTRIINIQTAMGVGL